MRLAIRVDASAQIGIGHVKRCLALAATICAGGLGEVLIVTRSLGGVAEHLLRTSGYAVEVLPSPDGDLSSFNDAGSPPHVSWAGVDPIIDAAQTTDRIAGWQPDWVLIDHYAFDARWHNALRSSTGARMAAIDDLADRALEVDLLVDHNISDDHHAKYLSRLPPSARMLGGPSFALLDPTYRTAPRYSFKDNVDSVGVFMGGADVADITPRVLRACRDSGFAGRIEVVSTRANPHLAKLQDACDGWAQAELVVDLPDLAAFFARHDLQIGAGGGASWERCCIGAPSLLIAVAENQLPVVGGLGKAGAARVLELGNACDSSLHRAIRELIDDPALRARLSDTARSFVDGCGAGRVAAELAAT
jgi:UDP-2,4-diacetamido-2,4,6-trideoxy-beta-L-altropyranose hydrolase